MKQNEFIKSSFEEDIKLMLDWEEEISTKFWWEGVTPAIYKKTITASKNK